MRQAIFFGGPGALPLPPGIARPWPPQGPGGLEFLLQEFFHYLGKIWLRNHPNLPQDEAGLASFRIAEVIADYRAYRSAGGEVPLDKGLELAESYILAQLVLRRPLTCLLNSEMPDMSTTAMARVRRLPPFDLIEEIRRRSRVELDTRRDITGQLQRWGDLAPSFPSLVYDGVTGHCILLRGIERKTGRLIYWDPWPLRSLLCVDKNKAGVAAQVVPGGKIFWTLSPEEMSRVLYSVFVPA